MQNKANFQKSKKSVSIYTKGYYEELCSFGRRKNKANSKPNKPNLRRDDVFGVEGLRLPQSRRSFAMTLVGYLKKQSQFEVRVNKCKHLYKMALWDFQVI